MGSPLLPAALAPTFVTNLGSTPTLIKQGSGVLGAVALYNPNASVTWIQGWNAASPSGIAEGTNPLFALPIAGTNTLLFQPPPGVAFGEGLVIAATTTPTGSTGPATALSGTLFTV